MEFNKHLRSAAVVLFGTVATFQVNAFSGTVIYRPNPTNATLIERASTTTARVSPEFDATYQRTMRNSMTRAAAVKAGVGLIRGLQVISTIGILVTLASDIHGIWTKQQDGTNGFLAPKTSNSCIPDDSACSMPQYPYRTYTLGPYQTTRCAYRSYDDTNPPSPPTFTGYWCLGTPASTTLPSSAVSDAELGDLVKADNPLIPLLQQLDDAGSPIVFPTPDVEDMPQPLVLNPKVTVKPDGSKVTEQTTLTPYRAPDGTTVNWERKASVIQETAPDANGNTVKNTTTTTDKAAPSQTPKDERPECEKSPDTLGCIKMDTPGGDIPKSEKNVSYVAESLFGAASCPATKTINQVLTGRSVVLSYAPTCDVLANYVKPLIIAIALYMAYLIILPGNQQ